MGEQRRSAFRFAEIHLRNWRNFLSVDVPLQWRAFLVGPNASGKSNFLDVIRFLADIVTVGVDFKMPFSTTMNSEGKKNPRVGLAVLILDGKTGLAPFWNSLSSGPGR